MGTQICQPRVPAEAWVGDTKAKRWHLKPSPGGLVVKIPLFQCMELRVQSQVRELRSHMFCGVAKKKR